MKVVLISQYSYALCYYDVIDTITIQHNHLSCFVLLRYFSCKCVPTLTATTTAAAGFNFGREVTKTTASTGFTFGATTTNTGLMLGADGLGGTTTGAGLTLWAGLGTGTATSTTKSGFGLGSSSGLGGTTTSATGTGLTLGSK